MKCPNCGAEIGRFELSQNCKSCGVNLFYINQQELLTQDVKRTELEFAAFRMFIERIKTTFIKGALPISRIVFTLLSVLALLVPFGTINLDMIFYSGKLSVGGIGIYQGYTNGALLSLLDYVKVDVAKPIAIRSIVILALFAICLLMAAACLVTEILSFTNIKRTAKLMTVFALIGAISGLCAGIFSFTISSAIPDFLADYVSSKGGFGGFVAMAMFIAFAIINILFVKKDIHPVFNEIDIKRRDLNKRVKKGEVSLDDLPCPVFEEVKTDGE